MNPSSKLELSFVDSIFLDSSCVINKSVYSINTTTRMNAIYYHLLLIDAGSNDLLKVIGPLSFEGE